MTNLINELGKYHQKRERHSLATVIVFDENEEIGYGYGGLKHGTSIMAWRCSDGAVWNNMDKTWKKDSPFSLKEQFA